MRDRILLVDDEARAREILADHLEPEGFEIVQAADGEEAIRRVQENDLNLVLLDLMLPDMNGIDVLKEIVRLEPGLPVIMVSGHGTIRDAVAATKIGAYDFLEKPVERERMLLAVKRALERDRLRREVTLLKEEALRRYQMIGASGPIQRVFKLIDEVAPANAAVLITGESGGGKELVARALHSKSQRSGRPFVKLNCAAIPETLIESELFGHEKGAFTGAINQKKGKLELGHGGTLLLDEVGDLSLASQAKMLRFLQEAEFERVGGTQTLKVDVRVISATNKDLAHTVKDRQFREDLYYRLNVIHIHVPPLRERREDIPVLADYFLERYAEENGVPAKQVTRAAREFLTGQPWPGNIRELENLMKRISILVRTPDVDASDLLPLVEPARQVAAGEERDLRKARDCFEREFIRNCLARNNGDKTRAAAELGIERAHLYRKLKDLGL